MYKCKRHIYISYIYKLGFPVCSGVKNLPVMQETQGWNLVLLHCWQILYRLSHLGTSRTTERPFLKSSRTYVKT